MIILLKSTEAQMISFIPRILEASSVHIINQATNLEVIYTPEFYTNDYYLTCSIFFDLVELQTYTLIVKDAQGNEIYLDKILCTNQNTDTFSINKDLYIYE